MRWPWQRTPQTAAPEAPRIEPRAPMHVSHGAVVAAGAKSTAATPFHLPPPRPGVLPSGSVGMAQDQNITIAYGYSAGTGGEGLEWLGYQYLTELTQRPEYRRISETIAKEMARRWIKLHAAGDDDKSERIASLEAALKRYRVQDLFRKAAEHDGFFGRAQIYLDTGDGDNPEELRTPLIVDAAKIKLGGLKRLATVEPIWTYPNEYDSSDPLRADYFKPKSWFVQGKTVHASRLLTFVGREVPDLLKPAYMFGGLSMSQMAKPYVDNWLRTRQSVSDLLHSFSTMVLSTNLSATLSGAGGESLQMRAQLFNLCRDNRGLMMLDKDTETLANVSTPLGSLDHLQAQAQEQMASVSAIPLVVLLGITPSGLNASSDGEIRTFYAWIESQQEHLFRPNLERLIRIIQLSEFGEIDDGITFTFEPLWRLDSAGAAAVRKTNADTDAVLVEIGAIGPEDVRQRVAQEEDSLYSGLDLSVAAPGPPDDAGGEFHGLGDPAERIVASGAGWASSGANAADAEPEWSEADHPRREDGRFVAGGGSPEHGHRDFHVESANQKRIARTLQRAADRADMAGADPATSKQLWYLASLMAARGEEPESHNLGAIHTHSTLTRRGASELIDYLTGAKQRESETQAHSTAATQQELAKQKAKIQTKLADVDTRTAEAFPEEWAAAVKMSGADRREAKRLLRRKYEAAAKESDLDSHIVETKAKENGA